MQTKSKLPCFKVLVQITSNWPSHHKEKIVQVVVKTMLHPRKCQYNVKKPLVNKIICESKHVKSFRHINVIY